jgi:glycosyltransferase involved in cell wall biosynthesis
MNPSPSLCAVVPTYDNPRTVGPTVRGIVARGLPVVLVDDGSAEPGRAACAALAREGAAELVRRERNGGKGAAVLDGFRRARELGHTHAFQIDGDGQHDLEAIPSFVAASLAQPAALVLGEPRYGADAPRSRTFARGLMLFFVRLETGGRARLGDALIGFRIYPLSAALAAPTRSRRMGFDAEILVHLVRAGLPVINLPVGVRYLRPEEGGVSHFRMGRDNLAFSALHARLTTTFALQWLAARLGWRPAARAAGGGRP